jgi:hypothetical protein
MKNHGPARLVLTASLLAGGLLLAAMVGAIFGLLAGGIFDRGQVQATATHGQDNYALATGELDADVELVAFLDPQSGYLKAAVMNVRNFKFQLFYTRNIRQDFEQESGKNPRYLMTTGRAVFNFQSGKRYARSVIYVTELNSGKCMAYGMQSFPNARSLHQKFHGALIPLDHIDFPKLPPSARQTAGQANRDKS